MKVDLDAVNLQAEALGKGVREDGQELIAWLHHGRHGLLVLKPACVETVNQCPQQAHQSQ